MEGWRVGGESWRVGGLEDWRWGLEDWKGRGVLKAGAGDWKLEEGWYRVRSWVGMEVGLRWRVRVRVEVDVDVESCGG